MLLGFWESIWTAALGTGYLHRASLVWKGTRGIIARYFTNRLMKPSISTRAHTHIYACVCVYVMCVQLQKLIVTNIK